MINSIVNLILHLILAPPRIMLSVLNSTPKSRTGSDKIGAGILFFCNPPYGRDIYAWVRKCYMEAQKINTIVVMLIPARTDTRYFHEFIYHKAREIRFIKGRLKFGGQKNSAPFPSMVVVF